MAKMVMTCHKCFSEEHKKKGQGEEGWREIDREEVNIQKLMLGGGLQGGLGEDGG